MAWSEDLKEAGRRELARRHLYATPATLRRAFLRNVLYTLGLFLYITMAFGNVITSHDGISRLEAGTTGCAAFLLLLFTATSAYVRFRDWRDTSAAA